MSSISEDALKKTVKIKKADPLRDPLRFQQPGLNFRCKLFGIEDVPEPRGDKMCQIAMAKLKAAVRTIGDHKQKVILNVSIDGIKIIDEKTEAVMYDHRVSRISFIARDVSDSRAFGYVYGRGDGQHLFFGIKTEKVAEAIVLSLRDLFQLVYEMKMRGEFVGTDQRVQIRKGSEFSESCISILSDHSSSLTEGSDRISSSSPSTSLSPSWFPTDLYTSSSTSSPNSTSLQSLDKYSTLPTKGFHLSFNLQSDKNHTSSGVPSAQSSTNNSPLSSRATARNEPSTGSLRSVTSRKVGGFAPFHVQPLSRMSTTSLQQVIALPPPGSTATASTVSSSRRSQKTSNSSALDESFTTSGGGWAVFDDSFGHSTGNNTSVTNNTFGSSVDGSTRTEEIFSSSVDAFTRPDSLTRISTSLGSVMHEGRNTTHNCGGVTLDRTTTLTQLNANNVDSFTDNGIFNAQWPDDITALENLKWTDTNAGADDIVRNVRIDQNVTPTIKAESISDSSTLSNKAMSPDDISLPSPDLPPPPLPVDMISDLSPQAPIPPPRPRTMTRNISGLPATVNPLLGPQATVTANMSTMKGLLINSAYSINTTGSEVSVGAGTIVLEQLNEPQYSNLLFQPSVAEDLINSTVQFSSSEPAQLPALKSSSNDQPIPLNSNRVTAPTSSSGSAVHKLNSLLSQVIHQVYSSVPFGSRNTTSASCAPVEPIYSNAASDVDFQFDATNSSSLHRGISFGNAAQPPSPPPRLPTLQKKAKQKGGRDGVVEQWATKYPSSTDVEIEDEEFETARPPSPPPRLPPKNTISANNQSALFSSSETQSAFGSRDSSIVHTTIAPLPRPRPNQQAVGGSGVAVGLRSGSSNRSSPFCPSPTSLSSSPGATIGIYDGQPTVGREFSSPSLTDRLATSSSSSAAFSERHKSDRCTKHRHGSNHSDAILDPFADVDPFAAEQCCDPFGNASDPLSMLSDSYLKDFGTACDLSEPAGSAEMFSTRAVTLDSTSDVFDDISSAGTTGTWGNTASGSTGVIGSFTNFDSFSMQMKIDSPSKVSSLPTLQNTTGLSGSNVKHKDLLASTGQATISVSSDHQLSSSPQRTMPIYINSAEQPTVVLQSDSNTVVVSDNVTGEFADCLHTVIDTSASWATFSRENSHNFIPLPNTDASIGTWADFANNSVSQLEWPAGILVKAAESLSEREESKGPEVIFAADDSFA